MTRQNRDPSSQGPHNERARGDVASLVPACSLPRTRQGRLHHWFRGPVNQLCGIGQRVPTNHEALGQENAATAARVRSRRRATCNSREETGLISHAASTAEQGHDERTQWPGSPWKQGLTDVSGARRVAAPVPRTGQCRHEWTHRKKPAMGLQNPKEKSTANCRQKPSVVSRFPNARCDGAPTSHSSKQRTGADSPDRA